MSDASGRGGAASRFSRERRVTATCEPVSLAGRRCLLVVPIPHYRAEDGTVWLDRLWRRDLEAHFEYLPKLALVSPRLASKPADMVPLRLPCGASLCLYDLPVPTSAVRSLLQLPRVSAAIWRAVRGSDLVQSGVGGWPYPLGLIANPLALMLRKPLIIVIESSFWRIGDPGRATWRARLRARLMEAFARWSVRRARLSVFTSTAYRDQIATPGSGALLVAPASWIGHTDVLSDAAAEAAWMAKPSELRLLFAGRLTAEKGTEVLLDAVREVDKMGTPLRIDIVGSGELEESCRAAAAKLRHVRMDVIDPVPYGPQFHALIRGYHALLVPSLTDEQPRIVYDAFSQAVPVVASDKGGHWDCVLHGETGYLAPAGDAVALADRVVRLASRPADLRALGRNALRFARGHTHAEMHRVRADAMRDVLDPMRR